MRRFAIFTLAALVLSVLVAPNARAIGDPDQPEGSRVPESAYCGAANYPASTGGAAQTVEAPTPVRTLTYCEQYESSGGRAAHFGLICMLEILMDLF